MNTNVNELETENEANETEENMYHTFSAPETETSSARTLTVAIARRYKEGHVCTKEEAYQLDLLIKQAIQNNWRKKFADGENFTQADIDEYLAKYSFKAARVVKSPMEKAIDEVTGYFIAAGIQKGYLTKDSTAEEKEAFLSVRKDKIQKEAARLLEARTSIEI